MYESGELAQTLGVEGDGAEDVRELPGETEALAPGLTQIENRLG